MPNSEDVSSWRLQSTGGIPYRFLGLSGGIDPEEASVDFRILIQANRLIDLATELFPPPIVTGLVYVPQGGTMPGLPNLFAKRMTFASQGGIDKPIDPFSADAAAVAKTYHGFIECKIEFGPSNISNATDPSDPRTFLEISASVGGDFIYTPSTNTSSVEETTPGGPEDEEAGKAGLDPETAEPKGPVTEAAPVPVRNPNLPFSVMVPKTEWSVKWRQIPFAHFRDVVIHRLRAMNGRVNSSPITFLYNAPAETVLFGGFSYSESYTWRNGNVATPPIDVEFKLIEKRVVYKGIICGHNHAWIPGLGWRRIKIGANQDEDPYRGWDMNFLFQV